MAEFLYKRGQKVTLGLYAEFGHQRSLWTSKDATITGAYISPNDGRTWYRIECEKGYGRIYRNSYPEGDLMIVEYNNNLEVKKLLTKEW